MFRGYIVPIRQLYGGYCNYRPHRIATGTLLRTSNKGKTMRKSALIVVALLAAFITSTHVWAQSALDTTTQILRNYYEGTPQQKKLAEEFLWTAAYGMISMNTVLEVRRLNEPNSTPIFCLPKDLPTTDDLFNALLIDNGGEIKKSDDIGYYFVNALRHALERMYPCAAASPKRTPKH